MESGSDARPAAIIESQIPPPWAKLLGDPESHKLPIGLRCPRGC
eukprot:CAMPEP_0179148716 /NCGR_PEP_ID=MMETSP0796-20121207/71990_1 /TAXON_ID=73915 /ORGANISM="Pyrodinium bahamense, Strain pbaha01" /LENGTH=43 /DNA_ID= /DNA_START= /DNA_END= /DNA_ORIENTATION=